MMKRMMLVVDSLIKWLVIVLMGISVINVLWQVFTRYVLNNPSSWTEELARYMLIWVSFLGAAYAVRLKMHLSIDVLTENLSGGSKVYSQMFVQMCIFLFALFVMVIGGIRLVNLTLSLNQISAALHVKLGYVYLIVPLTGLLIMFYSAVFFMENVEELNRQGDCLESNYQDEE
ncbi:MAG: TRAP transporter small permease [bacterium]|jgi:TRAP-type C4-dicarboxylate transport system permease small subunit